MNLEKIIQAAAEAAAEKAAQKTVRELRRSGALYTQKMTNYKKAEAKLRMYGAKWGITAEDAERIEKALAAISGEPYADTIQLFYLQNKTNAEIADILHASERTVTRARQKIMQKLTTRII